MSFMVLSSSWQNTPPLQAYQVISLGLWPIAFAYYRQVAISGAVMSTHCIMVERYHTIGGNGTRIWLRSSGHQQNNSQYGRRLAERHHRHTWLLSSVNGGGTVTRYSTSLLHCCIMSGSRAGIEQRYGICHVAIITIMPSTYIINNTTQ